MVVTSEAELIEALHAHPQVRISGDGAFEDWRRPVAGEPVEVQISGIVDFSPDDQVVVVRAGTSMVELQDALRERGQCLPVVGRDGDGWSPLRTLGTVGAQVSMNLPHELEAECGSWRDWILGCAAVTADGTRVRAGSRAVKNVAGYDAHKFLVGTRGALAVFTEITLRTFPLRSLPTPVVRRRVGDGDVTWVQRTLATDFPRATDDVHPGYDVLGTNTLVRYLATGESLPRFDGDWVLRAGCGEANLVIEDPTQLRYMQRAKAQFDPSGRLNPGEWPI